MMISRTPFRISFAGDETDLGAGRGRRVKELTTTTIVVDNFNYDQVKDIHLILGHVLSQYFRKFIVTEREICAKSLNVANIKVSFL